MKAQVLKSYGPNSKFSYEDVAKPTPKVGEVLIKVKASGVNPADYKAKEMGTELDFAPKLPGILGMDVSGVVESVGVGVTEFQVGDRVFGTAGGVTDINGSLAEYMVADKRLIAKVPESVDVSFKDLASLSLVNITAWNALFDFGQIKPGSSVLIFGAGGNVGLAAIQLAKWAGAHVVAHTRKNKMDLAKIAGADVVVCDENESTLQQNFDLVFDTIGGEHLNRSMPFARRNGKVATTIGFGMIDSGIIHGKGLTLNVVYMLLPMMYNEGRENHTHILNELAKLLDRKMLKFFTDSKNFSLSEANSAYEHAASGKAQGKVVLSW